MALTVKKGGLKLRPQEEPLEPDQSDQEQAWESAPPIRPAGPSYVPYCVFGIMALLVFAALLFIQAMEMNDYYAAPAAFVPRTPLDITNLPPHVVEAMGYDMDALLARPEAQEYTQGVRAMGFAGSLITAGLSAIPIALLLFAIVTAWKLFRKAGQPGWASLIPVYNAIVYVKVAGKPVWWFVLLLIPGVGLIAHIALCIPVARHFGKGVGFAIGLILLPIVFFPILAFGSAVYAPPPPPEPAPDVPAEPSAESTEDAGGQEPETPAE